MSYGQVMRVSRAGARPLIRVKIRRWWPSDAMIKTKPLNIYL